MSKVMSFIGGMIIGGLTGFVSTRLLLKARYRQKSDEEVASVKEAYRKALSEREGNSNDEQREANRPEPEEPKVTHVRAQRARDKGDISRYTNYARAYSADEPKPRHATQPTVIPPEDFGEKAGYELASLTWYADGVLTDESDHRLSEAEIERYVGRDALTHFGEYEDDSVYIRNDEMKRDYEILRDHRKYSDVLTDRPYLKE